jgi:hypothetical protein
MTELEPPMTPKPKSFTVCWADSAPSEFRNVTGSHREGDLLFLVTHDREWIVNIRESTLISVADDTEGSP